MELFREFLICVAALCTLHYKDILTFVLRR